MSLSWRRGAELEAWGEDLGESVPDADALDALDRPALADNECIHGRVATDPPTAERFWSGEGRGTYCRCWELDW